jgi:tRNA 2-thiouridine synthesizing protein A
MLVLNDMKDSRHQKIQELDIRGKVCPMTFVYTKLKLEEMKKGELLRVILDFPAAVDSVPANCKRQKIGETLEIETLDTEIKTWTLMIRKI